MYEILSQVFIFFSGYFTARIISAKDFALFLAGLNDDTLKKIYTDINNKAK